MPLECDYCCWLPDRRGGGAVQVGKLSSGDPLTTHRELYMRNVSSKDLALNLNGSEDEPDQELPPAVRQQGDTIAFDRYTCP